MGNDGGSIPDRRDLVKNKAKAEQPDKANQTRARWFFCAISKARLHGLSTLFHSQTHTELQRPLEEPIASCPLGKLYNKDAVIEYLLDRNAYGDGEEICGHIRSRKDLTALKLTRNTSKSPVSDSADRASFMCPLNYKEMNGSQPFVYLFTCGCVFSLSGLKAVTGSVPMAMPTPTRRARRRANDDGKQLDMCPQCGAKYDRTTDVIMLNPPSDEEEKMREALERRRAAEPPKMKGKKRKAKAEDAEGAGNKPVEKKKKKQTSPMPSTNPSIAAASRAVTQSLAEEEVKRKATMSQAVKSLYEPNGRKETL
ncbi:Rtf2 RING-finger-domain-containing protein [Fomitopsis serialis]|uniref:Rtf2 RING-finger-domain-containing protein n=1 Tax=Fomitopsis serialis TaxID=139415 RepID=UPI0020089FE4|nr:Rtf2 RING-finger-domain-containing protein [Neoantrodia serialis]KAH9920316.1 Rtf2 RING-finger-domain-containing protein [Neoantrodia serialis]